MGSSGSGLGRKRSTGLTRQRILESAVASAVETRFQLREIAAKAGVTVQTIYSHFGSKAGLISAVVEEVSRREGLLAELERVRSLPSGRSQLVAIVGATLDFWDRAWTYISMSLDLQRVDPEFAQHMRALDASRLRNLEAICIQLSRGHQLRPGMQPKAAAAVIFALTTPAAYEELVLRNGMKFARAKRLLVDAALTIAIGGR